MLRFIISIIIVFACFLNTVYADNIPAKTLSLQEAILLAVRENPNVQQAQLNLVEQKFALEVAKWQFEPHFNIQAIRTINNTVASGTGQTTNTTTIQPQMTLQTPIGTEVTLSAPNNLGNGHYNPGLSLQVIQHLMRGFGKPVVEAALYNAEDSEIISHLNVDGALRTTVTNVILAYLDVISAQNTVNIDKDALNRAQTSVNQTRMFIKAGRKAGVELVTVQADVANAQTKLENDKNALQQSTYALLSAIGIDPATPVAFSSIDVPALIAAYHPTDLQVAKKLIIDNDIQYQTDEITLHGATQRSLLIAKDNTRWQLDLTLNGTAGQGSGGGANAGINSLTNGYNNSKSAMLTLNIPIDDKAAQQAVLDAKIGLQEATLALQQERWQKETNAINGWNSISSAKRALEFAQNAEVLQGKTYHISFQKYTYGLIDSLELQQATQQYTASQQALLDARVAYLKSLVNLDQLTGNTLRTWGIGVHYD